MGIAILSGVLDSQKALQSSQSQSLSSSIASLSTTDNESSEDDLSQLPTRFIACVSRVESGRRLKKEVFPKSQYDVEVLVGENVKAAKEADVILLACKPNMVQDILAEDGMKEALKGKLVVSICAGLRIQQMRDWVDSDTKVVRAMPNTPSKVSKMYPDETKSSSKALLGSVEQIYPLYKLRESEESIFLRKSLK